MPGQKDEALWNKAKRAVSESRKKPEEKAEMWRQRVNYSMALFEAAIEPQDIIDSARGLLAVAHTIGGVACKVCDGHGYRAYGSTSTWRGGGGGQAFTSDVCDQCWGSGRSDKPHGNLRAAMKEKKDEIERLTRERDEARAEAKRADEEATALANSNLATTEQVVRALRAEIRTLNQRLDCTYGDTPGLIHCPPGKPCAMHEAEKRQHKKEKP